MNIGDNNNEVKKDELECFLSILNYNKHEFTKVSDISKYLYEEDDKLFFDRVSWKTKAEPLKDFCESAKINFNEIIENEANRYDTITK